MAVALATPAFGDWEELEPVPEFQVGDGAAITYGGGRVWGVFPTPDSDETYIHCYNLAAQEWQLPGECCVTNELLKNTAIAWQWLENGALFIVGNEDGDPMLYRYVPGQDEWTEEDIDDFRLGPGASIAYRPNPDMAPLYPIPGWLYCLAGGGRQFWRYTIPTSLEDQTVDGIHPGEGAIIADRTPNFIWPEVSGASQYRLLVADNVNFNACEIDELTTTTSYQVTSALGNGDHYWKVGAWTDIGGWTWTDAHQLQLQAGWTRLADIPQGLQVSDGGAIAYEKDYYGNTECIIALFGGGGANYYKYVISQNNWASIRPTPPDQNAGSALVTHEATQQSGSAPWAIFGQGSSNLPWYHSAGGTWRSKNTEFPQDLGPGASLAYTVESDTPYLYLIVGQKDTLLRNDFYRLALVGVGDGEGEGGQSDFARPSSGWARLVGAGRTAVVEYSLGAPAEVRATISDAAGRVVATLYQGRQTRGTHRLIWDARAPGSPVSSGVHFILLDAGKTQATFKVVVR
ncbi:MAG: hypothetical protein ABIK86_00445 [candidate division WOR-3 bacterium]